MTKIHESFDFSTNDEEYDDEVVSATSAMLQSCEPGDMLKYDAELGLNFSAGEDIALCVCEAAKSPSGKPLFMSASDAYTAKDEFPTVQFGGCGEHAPFTTKCEHESLAYYAPSQKELDREDPMPEDTDGYANTLKLAKCPYYTICSIVSEYNPHDSGTAGKWYIPSIGELHAVDYKQIQSGFFTSKGVLWSSSLYDDKMVYVHSNSQARLCEYGMDGYAYLRPFLNIG